MSFNEQQLKDLESKLLNSTSSTITTQDTSSSVDTTLSKKYCEVSVKKLAYMFDTKKYAMFIVFLFVLYFSVYFTARRLKWESDKKDATKHYEDIITLLLFGTVIFTFSNMSFTFNYITIIGMFIGSFGIAYLGQLPGFNFSVQNITTISRIPMITVIALASILAVAAYTTFSKYTKCNYLPYFWFFFLLPVAIVGSSYAVFYYQDKQNKKENKKPPVLHLHHWQWSIPLIFLFRFPNDIVSSFLSGILIGIFTDGIARYGPDSIFSDG